LQKKWDEEMPGHGINQSIWRFSLSMLMLLAKSQHRNAWRDK
jgi:hypothetical protein